MKVFVTTLLIALTQQASSQFLPQKNILLANNISVVHATILPEENSFIEESADQKSLEKMATEERYYFINSNGQVDSIQRFLAGKLTSVSAYYYGHQTGELLVKQEFDPSHNLLLSDSIILLNEGERIHKIHQKGRMTLRERYDSTYTLLSYTRFGAKEMGYDSIFYFVDADKNSFNEITYRKGKSIALKRTKWTVRNGRPTTVEYMEFQKKHWWQKKHKLLYKVDVNQDGQVDQKPDTPQAIIDLKLDYNHRLFQGKKELNFLSEKMILPALIEEGSTLDPTSFSGESGSKKVIYSYSKR